MKKRKKSFPKITVLLLAASAVLLVGSGVGSARAALTYYSENYSAQMNMQSIGVSLVENDAVVSSRDYVSDNEWSGSTVQTHNAQEAIKSAWGVDVSVNDDETVMSLQ